MLHEQRDVIARKLRLLEDHCACSMAGRTHEEVMTHPVSAAQRGEAPAFRDDIQGLRAIAVVAVILNHLELPWFSGGFVGVDMFFVISGYLITRQLSAEFINTGTISLKNFYVRRLRRLFPAAIATCFLTLLAGYVLFSQEKLELLAESALAALFSIANIYFWLQVDYFDTEAASKPLLHMWSLGVEEQFYLVWPCLLWLGLRVFAGRTVAWGVLAIGAASFLLNHLWLDTSLPERFATSRGWLERLENPAASTFYLMPFRIFEFSIGALAAIRPRPSATRGNSTHARTAFMLAAVAILLYGVTQFNATTVFPYYNALAIACATGMVIYFGGNSSAALDRLLSNHAMVYVGAISYALYLVHWPIIVMYRHLSGPLEYVDICILLVIITCFAWTLYNGVEQPCRYEKHRDENSRSFWKKPVPRTLAALASTSVLAFTAPQIPGRIPDERQTLTNREWRQQEVKQYCKKPIPGFPDNIFTCQSYRNTPKTIIIWGDSHAMHLVGGFAKNFPQFNIAISYASGCTHQSGLHGYTQDIGTSQKTAACIEKNRQMLDWLHQSTDKYIVFLSSAKRDTPGRMSSINNDLIERLRAFGHDAWVLGDYIRPGTELANCRAVPDILVNDRWLARLCLPDHKTVTSELDYARAMSKLTRDYIPLHDVQCPLTENCRFWDQQGRATFRDTHHLSHIGSAFELQEALPMITHITHITPP